MHSLPGLTRPSNPKCPSDFLPFGWDISYRSTDVRYCRESGHRGRTYGVAKCSSRFLNQLETSYTRPAVNGSGYELRRSAVQLPEQEPPLHEPPPAEPASLPEPVALLPPALTVTVIAPVCATLPVTVNTASPALMSWPCEMRIGYR